MSTDKQLDGISLKAAKRKWSEGLPVTLKEMAVALEMSYNAVIELSKEPGFPYSKRLIWPRRFDHWNMSRVYV